MTAISGAGLADDIDGSMGHVERSQRSTQGPSHGASFLHRGSLPVRLRHAIRAASLVVPLLTASCSSLGEQSSSSGASSASSGVDGIIAVGPTCPVQQINAHCLNQPVSTTVQLLDGAGRTVARGRSNAGGHYTLRAAAGDYVLLATSTSPGNGCPRTQVTVVAGRWTDASILCDSGIR
jgi:hypothetical protein